MSNNPFVGDLTRYNSMRDLANERRQRELAIQYGKENRFLRDEYDPTVMHALFTSEFWRRDVTPRLQEMWAAASDKEFWTEDIVRNAKSEGPTAVKAAGAGFVGTPADLAVLGWHTLKWAASNVGLIERGDYSWIEDMPDFEDIPLTSDWIGEKILDEDVRSLAWIAGSLATPDLSAVNKAGIWFGSLMGLAPAMEMANKAGDVKKAQGLLRGYEEASQQIAAVRRGELKNSQLWKETGWMVGMDGQLRYMMDPRQIKMDWDSLSDQLSETMERAKTLRKGEAQTSNPIPLSAYYDHPEAMGVYGDDLKHLKTSFDLVYLPDGRPQGYGGVILENANGDKFQISGTGGLAYGGGQTPTRQAANSRIRMTGMPDQLGPLTTKEELIAVLTHEINHWISGVEGFARGGSSERWKDAINGPLKMYRQNLAKLIAMESMIKGVTETGEAVSDSTILRQIRRYFRAEDHTSSAEDLAKRLATNTIYDAKRTLALNREASIMNGGTGSEGFEALLKTQKHFLKIWESGVTDIMATYIGKVPSRQLIQDFADIADPELINSMASNMYHRLYDEGMSRLAEEFYLLRDDLTDDQIATMLDDEYMITSVMRDAIQDEPKLAHIGVLSSEQPIFRPQGVAPSPDDRMLLSGEDVNAVRNSQRGSEFLPPETLIEGREPGLAMEEGATYLEDVQNKPTTEEAVRALIGDAEDDLDFIDVDEDTGVVGLGDVTRE